MPWQPAEVPICGPSSAPPWGAAPLRQAQRSTPRGPAAGALKDAAAALARDWPEEDEEEDPVEDDDADMKELNEFLDEE